MELYFPPNIFRVSLLDYILEYLCADSRRAILYVSNVKNSQLAVTSIFVSYLVEDCFTEGNRRSSFPPFLFHAF